MAASAPNVIFGSASIGGFEEELTASLLQILEQNGVKYIDTASLYANSEATLGKHDAPKKFVIHTKAPGFIPGAMTKKGVLDGAEKSLKDLGVSSVDTYYLHCPDTEVPIEETLSAIQELYEAGKFKHFGLSNFKAEDVKKIHAIQAANKTVLPSVFQGNYNAVSRHIETDLFPVLRDLKISFNAYSPIAGGFLVKDPADIRSKDIEGRFSDKTGSGSMYSTMYSKPTLLDALETWAVIAKEAGLSKAALAYRWISYHSALKATLGDGLIIGASKSSQLEETLAAIKQGPLDENIAAKVDALWAKVKDEAPIDNYHSYLKK